MIIYLDTETSGLNPGQICQLSYILQDGTKVKAKNFFFDVDYVEFGAYMVHGFSVEKLRVLSCGLGFNNHFQEIEKDFNSADVICAHNTSFDFKFLSKEFERCGSMFLPKEQFCTMKNSITACKLPRTNSRGYKYPKLAELCSFLGVSDSQISQTTTKLFGSQAGYHDARFDTTALFISTNKGVQTINEFAVLQKYL